MEKVKFNVSSKTARLIGRENISDSNGAIIELVKNAYDADASIVSIVMVSPDSLENGCIEIEDDGFGTGSPSSFRP